MLHRSEHHVVAYKYAQLLFDNFLKSKMRSSLWNVQHSAWHLRIVQNISDAVLVSHHQVCGRLDVPRSSPRVPWDQDLPGWYSWEVLKKVLRSQEGCSHQAPCSGNLSLRLPVWRCKLFIHVPATMCHHVLPCTGQPKGSAHWDLEPPKTCEQDNPLIFIKLTHSSGETLTNTKYCHPYLYPEHICVYIVISRHFHPALAWKLLVHFIFLSSPDTPISPIFCSLKYTCLLNVVRTQYVFNSTQAELNETKAHIVMYLQLYSLTLISDDLTCLLLVDKIILIAW